MKVRWNSTLKMIESTKKLRSLDFFFFFTFDKCNDSIRILWFMSNRWTVLEATITVFSTMRNTTATVSASSYTTGSRAHIVLEGLEHFCNTKAGDKLIVAPIQRIHSRGAK